MGEPARDWSHERGAVSATVGGAVAITSVAVWSALVGLTAELAPGLGGIAVSLTVVAGFCSFAVLCSRSSLATLGGGAAAIPVAAALSTRVLPRLEGGTSWMLFAVAASVALLGTFVTSYGLAVFVVPTRARVVAALRLVALALIAMAVIGGLATVGRAAVGARDTLRVEVGDLVLLAIAVAAAGGMLLLGRFRRQLAARAARLVEGRVEAASDAQATACLDTGERVRLPVPTDAETVLVSPPDVVEASDGYRADARRTARDWLPNPVGSRRAFLEALRSDLERAEALACLGVLWIGAPAMLSLLCHT